MIPCILFASLLLLHSLFPVGSSTRLEPAGDCKDPRYPPPTRGSLGAAFSPEELDAAQNTALEKHNYYRGLHDTPPLTISNDTEHPEHLLPKLAQAAALCNVKWDVVTRTQEGENIFYANVSSKDTLNVSDIATQAVDAWYEEYCKVKQPEDVRVSGTGTEHFTQLIWKSTKFLGVGFAQGAEDPSGTKSVFVVARYSPVGNYHGQESDAVGSLTSNKSDSEMCCRQEKVFASKVKAGTVCGVAEATRLEGGAKLVALLWLGVAGMVFYVKL